MFDMLAYTQPPTQRCENRATAHRVGADIVMATGQRTAHIHTRIFSDLANDVDLAGQSLRGLEEKLQISKPPCV